MNDLEYKDRIENYTLHELEEARMGVNQDKYPQRYEMILSEIDKIKSGKCPNRSVPQQEIASCPICGTKVKTQNERISCGNCDAILEYPKYQLFGNKIRVKKRKEPYTRTRQVLLFAFVSTIPLALYFYAHKNIILGMGLLSGSLSLFISVYFGFKEGVIYSYGHYVARRSGSIGYNFLLYAYISFATMLLLFGSQLIVEELMHN